MRCFQIILSLAVALGLGASARAAGTNTLVWKMAADRVSADIRGEALWPLLEDIANQTGWHIFVEPGTDRQADVKFRNLSAGDALKKLLGDLNFALVPQTNGPALLYVFSTTMQAATRPVAVAAKAKHVANQLEVIIKPGADIDAIAKSVGAKVVGRDDKDHMYLLEFADAAATDAALAQLQSDSDVESVSYNPFISVPATPQAIPAVPAGTPALTLSAPSSDNPCVPVIGLIDTQVQTLGNGLDQYIKKPISVVGNVAPVTGTITHGSAMAYTILNALSQTSKTAAQILPVDVYASGDTTTSWDVALGVQAAVNGGATVLNMSLGSTEDSSALDNVIQQAEQQGIVVFAAAGNSPVASSTYPAADPGVNAVTALSAPNQLASYADYGSFVDMALPGTSYVYLGNQAYMVQGTSPATAYATGIAAGNKMINCGSWSSIETGMDKQFPMPQGQQ